MDRFNLSNEPKFVKEWNKFTKGLKQVENEQYAYEINFLMEQLGVNLKIKFDKNKPNGTPRKILDSSLAKSYGWKANFDLVEGFKLTFDDFIKNKKNMNK